MINKTEILSLFPQALFDEPMKTHTTFRIGGNADCFISAKSTKEIIDALSYAKENNIPLMIMGNGSNMLVSDKGIRGIVLQVSKEMNSCKNRRLHGICRGGNFALVSCFTSAKGWTFGL